MILTHDEKMLFLFLAILIFPLFLCILTYAIGDFFDTLKLRFNRIRYIIGQYICTKFSSYRLNDKEVIFFDNFGFWVNLGLVCHRNSRRRTLSDKLERFFIDGFGHKKTLSSEELCAVKELSEQFLFIVEVILTINSNAGDKNLQLPEAVNEIFINSKPLFIDKFFKLLFTHIELNNHCTKDTNNNTQKTKDSCEQNSSPRKNVSTCSKEEIISLFDWLNFKDQIGHPLTMCQDFHDLLNRINLDNK